MVDLSPLGAWLRTNKPLEPGTRCELRFALGGSERFSVHAEVMWSSSRAGRGGRKGMALEFVGLAREDRGRLVQLLAQQPAAPNPAHPSYLFSDCG